MTTGATVLGDRALHLFAIPEDDFVGLRLSAEAVRGDAVLAEWVERTATELRAAVGTPSPPPALTSRPQGDPTVCAYLPVLALAEVLPATVQWAQTRGLPASVVAATMRDVGRMLKRNRLWFGEPGLGDELAGWLTRHVIGSILEVGRLQYERSPVGPATAVWLRNEGVGLGPGDLAVKLHIPEAGPFTEAAVTESLRAAKRLLRKYFGEERFAACVCVSWLLDPQLAEYLPPTSNIVAFQRLFRIGPAKDDDGDASVRKFVFGNAEAPLDELPQMSSLHRAAVAHWRRGKHWRVHVGRLP